MKAIMVLLAVALALGIWLPTPVHAQDLTAELSSALAANVQAVETIQSAETAVSPEASRTLVLRAVSEAELAKARLQNALVLATTDEQRSRIEGLIDHLDAAINAGREAQTAREEVISSIVDAVRGELVEALTELQPFAPEVARPQITPAPQELPRAGDGLVSAEFLTLLVIAGAASLLLGLRISSALRPG